MDLGQDPNLVDTTVRAAVYEHAMRYGLPPAASVVAAELDLPAAAVRGSLGRLADAHVLVLQREGDEILMAPPFSAVPTPFLVTAGGRSYFGNCIWDALGVPAMLGRDAEISASCGCCASAMTLRVTAGTLAPAPGVAHFAVPAARWWEDVVFT